MIRRRSTSLLLLVGLTVALLPLSGFASEEAEACPVGPEACGYVTGTVIGAACVSPGSVACILVTRLIEDLDLTGCDPTVCDAVTRVFEIDPWATAITTADEAAHIAVTRYCGLVAAGPTEENGGLTLDGVGGILCRNSDGDPPVQMSLTVCIQMNAGPGQIGWADVYCNSGESLPNEDYLEVHAIGACIPGPGEGHRWRVRATGEAWFTHVGQPADFAGTVDSFGRRLDCQPG